MSEKSWVPDGYSVIDIAVPDEVAAEIGEGNALVWKKPAKGEDYIDISIEFCPVIVPTTPPAEQYREPTQADVGKMVEVRDSQDHRWENFELLAVIRDGNIRDRFVCRDPEDAVESINWRFARIKNEEAK